MESYFQFTDEEKYAYCNVEAMGNLIMGVGENGVDYHTRLNVLWLFLCFEIGLLLLRI